MIISIDCRCFSSSGIGVYIQGCLPYFLNSDNYFYLLGNATELTPLVENCKNIEILEYHEKPFSLAELFSFPSNYRRKINSGDLFYSPYFNIPGGINVPVYTTIHDIIFPDMPELTSRLGLAMRMFFYRRAFSLSKKIFTVSEFSKSRIEHYSKNKVPVVVTYSAIQSWLSQRAAESKYKTPKNKTIVFIGNIKKHKGLNLLLEAFQLAKAEGLPHRLVIIGSRDNFRTSDSSILKKIDSLSADSILFSNVTSNEELAEYVSAAALLVQPSLYEGFGLPPLEAMVLGTQALVSDIQTFTEIYDGFPVVFFRAGDCIDLKHKLIDLLVNNHPEAVSLPEHLLSKYTFEKTSEIILKNMEQHI